VKKTIEFIKTTAIGGLMLILPVAVIIFILGYLINLMVSLNNTLATFLPYEIFDNALVIMAIAILSIIFICFAAGLLLRTGLGESLAKALDNFLINKIPMYGFIKNVTQRITGDDVLTLTPAEVNLFGSEARSLAFVIEEIPDNRFAVFVPSSPALTMGQVYILPASSVKMLDKPVRDAIDAISQWGSGMTHLYEDTNATDDPDESGHSGTAATTET
jgi:uncharacterized membrane protein